MKDFEQVMLIVAAVQGLLLSVALFFSGWRKNKPAMYLAVALFVFAIELLNAWAMAYSYHARKEAIPFWTFGSYLLLPPSLWFFLNMNRGKRFNDGAKTWIWFMPGIFEIVVELVGYYSERNGIMVFLGSMGWIGLTEYLPIIATVCVLILLIFLPENSSKQSSMNKHFGRQQWYLVVFIILVLLWIADSIFKVGVYHIIEILLSLLLLSMGYIVYFNPTFFEVPTAERQRNVNQFSIYDDEQSMRKLMHLFEKEQVFLRARLTLEEISSELGLPSRYISYLINHIYKCNFNQFVNNHRVEEVLRRMEDPKNSIKTLLGIALDSGFSSKSSFNAAFKSVTGKAPSAFLKER